jgi:16S rRNA (cytosine1402-N4)-methyltransferase
VFNTVHIPVLQKEVIKYLDPKPNENFVDCTLDGGGHALMILERSGKGKVLGIDYDQEILKTAKERISKAGYEKRAIVACDNYANLKLIIDNCKFKSISGILLDLGMSSWHIEDSKRGFSFSKNEPLDMRYGADNPLTAEKILNYWSEQEIERVLKEFGEEGFSEQIAKTIIRARKMKPIRTTFQLVEVIKMALPSKFLHQKIHFATRTFQALRIAVNSELDNLKKVLPQALDALDKDGRLVVISFHSLEDRIVKNFFRDKESEQKLKVATNKPITPSDEEIRINPRSRSSKLRAAIKI